MRLNGTLIPITNLPGYFESGVTTRNYAHIHVDRSGINYWGTVWGVTGNTPVGTAATIQTNRQMVLSRAVFPSNQPLIARRSKVVTERSIYDWSSINLAAPNFFEDKTETSRVTVDHVFRIRSGSRRRRKPAGIARSVTPVMSRVGAGCTGYLVFDVSERLLNGNANPDFLRPLIQASEPRMNSSPLLRDTFRLQLAYKLDFSKDQGFRRWLGSHQLVGYSEYKDQVQRTYVTQDQISSVQPWTFPTPPTGSPTSLRATSIHVGDNKGFEYAPGRFTTVLTSTTGAMPSQECLNNEPVELGERSSNGTFTVIKTQGALLQSQFLQGRIVTTFGKRQDRQFAKFSNLFQLKDRGFNFDYDFINQWRPGDWQSREGKTETRGVVVKPFRGFEFIEHPAAQGTGVTKFVADTLRGATVHYNRPTASKPRPQNVFFEFSRIRRARARTTDFRSTCLAANSA